MFPVLSGSGQKNTGKMPAPKNKGQARLRPEKSNVIPFKRSRASARRLRATRGPVHGQKIVSAQLLAFPRSRSNQVRPVVLVDTPALLPLLGGPGRHANVGGHLAAGIPPAKQFIKGLRHMSVVPLDRMSSQGRTTRPVTPDDASRTMCPMGKATTPARFRREFCARLRSAREFRGFSQEEFAKKLHVLPNTYSKYERRSPMPHYLVPLACGFLDISPDYLYGLDEEAQQQA